MFQKTESETENMEINKEIPRRQRRAEQMSLSLPEALADHQIAQ